MKYIITTFIIFTIALRPILPLINYAVNYDFIVENLCENKDKPELMCNGKCYVSKELSKNNNEQTTQNGQKISVPTIDIFLVTEDFKFINSEFKNSHRQSISTFYTDFYNSQHQSKIFHPPLI
ncbi:hypothetical protein ACI513_04010 [Chryseobacterium sp. M5]|uniref:hypothetical protein n=1 Tax=Chryseobacterium sp. M5 TaxID=3379128 RepID=UPI0038572309